MLIYVKELAQLNWGFSGIITEINTQRLKSMFLDTGKISERDYEQIIGITKKTAYGMWLAKKVSDDLVKSEDIYKWEEYFKIFDRRKRDFKYNDINRYKSEDDLRNFMDEVLLIKRAEQDDPSAAKGVSKANKYKQYKLGEVEGFSVYEIPKGREDLYGMSCDLGSGTEWCTANGKNRDDFDSYINQGALYLFLHPDGRKYQFNIEENQYMDRDDNPINVGDKLFAMFLKFLEEKGVEILFDIKIINHDVFELSENDLEIDALSLRGYNIRSLPDNLKIETDLDLYETNLKKLPRNLTVGHTLDLTRSKTVYIPEDIKVGYNILLRHNKRFETLPDNLTLFTLNLADTNIKNLPRNLTVHTLYINYSKVSELPSDLKVNGNIFAGNTPLSKKYSKEEIRAMVTKGYIKGEIKV